MLIAIYIVLFIGACALIVSGLRDQRLCKRYRFNHTTPGGTVTFKSFEDSEKFEAVEGWAKFKVALGIAAYIAIPIIATVKH